MGCVFFVEERRKALQGPEACFDVKTVSRQALHSVKKADTRSEPKWTLEVRPHALPSGDGHEKQGWCWLDWFAGLMSTPPGGQQRLRRVFWSTLGRPSPRGASGILHKGQVCNPKTSQSADYSQNADWNCRRQRKGWFCLIWSNRQEASMPEIVLLQNGNMPAALEQCQGAATDVELPLCCRMPSSSDFLKVRVIPRVSRNQPRRVVVTWNRFSLVARSIGKAGRTVVFLLEVVRRLSK